MAKRPDRMTPDERLTRILSLERKVRDLEHRLDWAEREQASCQRWGEKAWEEGRHLRDITDRLWDERNEYRQAAGLVPEPKYIPQAVFNHDSREWIPMNEVEQVGWWVPQEDHFAAVTLDMVPGGGTPVGASPLYIKASGEVSPDAERE